MERDRPVQAATKKRYSKPRARERAAQTGEKTWKKDAKHCGMAEIEFTRAVGGRGGETTRREAGTTCDGSKGQRIQPAMAGTNTDGMAPSRAFGPSRPPVRPSGRIMAVPCRWDDRAEGTASAWELEMPDRMMHQIMAGATPQPGAANINPTCNCLV